MGMELGKIKNSNIKVLIEWIKNKVWGFTLGQENNLTKVSLKMILEMGMVKFMI